MPHTNRRRAEVRDNTGGAARSSRGEKGNRHSVFGVRLYKKWRKRAERRELGAALRDVEAT